MEPLELPTVLATRYVTPLREGGSLPAIVEASDLGFYVLKFRGAGQGPLARRSIGALRQHYPDLTVSEVERGMPPLPPSQCDLVFGALQEVGLPA